MLSRWRKRRAQLTAELLAAGYRYAHALDASGHEAEDLVHDAWLRLVHGGYPVPDKPLLFRTIRNAWIDRHRRRQRHVSVSFDEHDADVRRVVETDTLDLGAPDAALQAALARLRGSEREALFLMVVEGYTAEEVARLTDRSRGSVLSLVHRAKQKLRAWLEVDPGHDARQRASTPPDAAHHWHELGATK